MNIAVERFSTDQTRAPTLSTRLAQWYRTQSSVRRLWAIDDRGALIVFVALEPTSDGDDTLPIWLANQHDWMNDLSSLTERDLQLALVSGVLEDADLDASAVVLAELNWRDPWISP